jgi:hypothetical protein
VHTSAVRGPDHERTAEVAVRAVPDAGGLRHDLIEGRVDEVGELDLGHRPQAVQGHADADPHDHGLGQRRIDHPHLAELLHEPGGDPEHATPRTDVLAEYQDAVVGLHLVPQGVVERVDHVLLAHRPAPVTSLSLQT